ncbi:MAG: hypothetical protein HYZ37_18565 [Candidatus Solibacter usitatus]|nr:hypothetical protein [Candidatus Solibacter usitatus]
MSKVLIFLLLALPLRAAWWKAEKGESRVYSDISERAARETLASINSARRSFEVVMPRQSKPPIVGFVLSDPLFRSVRPDKNVAAFYQSSALADFIVVRANAQDRGRATFHEFAHLASHHSLGVPLPPWLEEGLAEVYSTLEPANSSVRLGISIQEHVRLLGNKTWLSAQELGSVAGGSALWGDEQRVALFYAQSWVLTHLLRLDSRYRDGFAGFLREMRAGVPQHEAFPQAFGKSYMQASADAAHYLQRGNFPAVMYPLPPDSASATHAASCSGVEGELAFSRLAIAAQKPQAADSIYQRLSQMKRDPQVLAGLGILSMALGKAESAKEYLAAASAAPDAEADVVFEYGILLRDEGAANWLPFVQRAVARNPLFAEARFVLGVALANQGKHSEAIPHLEKAAEILPRQASFWQALAFSYFETGAVEKSRVAAKRALDSATKPDEKEAARVAVDRPDSRLKEMDTFRPGVIVPESWQNPKGDRKTEGQLLRIDCLGPSARFFIRSNETTKAYWVDNPGKVVLKNLSTVSFEFRCGDQEPRAVIVEYKSQPDETRGTEGMVTSLEFQ